jgi:hypothetical protein
MTELITLENETPTVTSGNWDPRETTVPYGQAQYASTTVDGARVEEESAQQVANTVDRLVADQAGASVRR